MSYRSINQVVLSRIEMFEVLAHQLHFGKTAQALGVSQSSLSEQIRNLEADLGLVLFDRDTRNVRLTSEGRLLVGPARTLLDQAQRFRNTAQAAASRSGELVRLGYPPSATTSVMSAMLPTLSSLPDLTIELRAIYAVDVPREIEVGNIDVALMFSIDEARLPGLGWTDLISDQATVVVGPTHPLADAESTSTSEFSVMPMALGGDLVGARRAQLENRFERLGHPLNIVHASNTVNDLILHLLAGQTIGLGTALLAKVGLDAGLRSIPIVEDISVQWGFAHSVPLTGAAASVVECLIDEFDADTVDTGQD